MRNRLTVTGQGSHAFAELAEGLELAPFRPIGWAASEFGLGSKDDLLGARTELKVWYWG